MLFKVNATTSGCHHNTKLEIPITIGTYPLASSDESNQQSEPNTEGYNFLVSVTSGPIVRQPTVGFNPLSAPGPEQTDPLLSNHGDLTDTTYSPAEPPIRSAADLLPPIASPPYPEAGKINAT